MFVLHAYGQCMHCCYCVDMQSCLSHHQYNKYQNIANFVYLSLCQVSYLPNSCSIGDVVFSSAGYCCTCRDGFVTTFTWPLKQTYHKGYSSQKSIDYLLNPFCIKLVTIRFSACNFAIVYLYKEIKFKPTISYYYPMFHAKDMNMQ